MRNRQHLASVGRGNQDETLRPSSLASSGSTDVVGGDEPSRDPIYDLTAELLEQAARSLDLLVKLLAEQAEGMREDARTLRKHA